MLLGSLQNRLGQIVHIIVSQALMAAAFALFWIAAAAAQGPSPLERGYTLEEAQRLAQLNNAALLSSEQDIVVAQQRVQEARFQFLPELGLQASGTRYNARYPFALAPEFRSILLFPSDIDNIYSGRTYLRQSLYEGGRVVNLLRLAQTALKQAQTQYDTVKLDIAFNTKTVFYRLVLAQDMHAALTERLRDAERLLQQPGFSDFERIEAEGMLAELRVREAAAGRAVEAARLDFRRGLNLELDTPVRVLGSLETKPAAVDLDKAVVWATELRPELQAETYKAQMDAIAVNLAMGRRNPTLVLAGDYEVTGQRFPLRQNNWDLTLGLRIPFSYDFWTQLRQKKAEQRQGEVKRAELHDRVRMEVRQAYDDLQFWQNEWPLREREYKRIAGLFKAARGKGGMSLLRAQNAVLGVQERYFIAVGEHLLARARLERAIGRPLP